MRDGDGEGARYGVRDGDGSRYGVRDGDGEGSRSRKGLSMRIVPTAVCPSPTGGIVASSHQQCACPPPLVKVQCVD